MKFRIINFSHQSCYISLSYLINIGITFIDHIIYAWCNLLVKILFMAILFQSLLNFSNFYSWMKLKT